jgi:hypothetical protein
MKPKTIFLIPTLVIAALVTSIGMAFAQTAILTFDDLSFSDLYEQIPNGYGGLRWNNFFVLNTAPELSSCGRNGEVNGGVSPNNMAFNGSAGLSTLFDGARADRPVVHRPRGEIVIPPGHLHRDRMTTRLTLPRQGDHWVLNREWHRCLSMRKVSA